MKVETKWKIEEICIQGHYMICITCPNCGESFTVTENNLPRERFCRWCGQVMMHGVLHNDEGCGWVD